jgi:hypothetical protein
MVETSEQPPEKLFAARGGVSIAAVLAGMMVSIGAFFLLSAVVGGILSVGGVDAEDLAGGTDAGIGPGIALILAFFISYLWGGYTAGRMSRGAGVVNGLLVPLIALLAGALIGVIVWALGTTAQLNFPFSTNRLPLKDTEYVVEWTLGLGAAALIAMFVGGIIGGWLGSRWHGKLERRVATEYQERRVEEWREEHDDVTEPVPGDVGDEQAETRPVQIYRHPSVGGAPPPPPPPTEPDHEHDPTREFPPRT